MKDVGEWFDLYQKMVYGYLIGLCGSKELAEELTQETFYQALKSLDHFREDSSPSTWLCGIARNLFFSELRRPKDKFELPQTPPDPLETLIQNDRVMEGQRALHQLAEPYREVFTLRTFCDLSHAQIGGLFDKSAAWARVTYYRARQQLAQKLKEEMKDEM